MAELSTKKPCYIPLSLTSQCHHENVLFYNANACEDSIYECAMGKLHAAINMAENLYEYSDAPPKALQSFAVVFSLLLNDAYTLLEEHNPIAVKLRNEQPIDKVSNSQS